MLKHIVMWKFSDGEGKTKQENLQIVRQGLEALLSTVSQLKSLEFIENEVTCERNFDAMLVVGVSDETALDEYKNHPEHQRVAEYIAKITLSRAAVDYYC